MLCVSLKSKGLIICLCSLRWFLSRWYRIAVKTAGRSMLYGACAFSVIVFPPFLLFEDYAGQQRDIGGAVFVGGGDDTGGVKIQC